MLDCTTFLVLDAKPNRHSWNALVGAIETDPGLDAMELRLAASETQLSRLLTETLSAGRYPIVGISLSTLQFWGVRELLHRLPGPTGQCSHFRCIAGGPHATADPQGTLELGFDAVVCGEGELALPGLLKTLAVGGDLAGVPGIAYRDASGQIRQTERPPSIDLDAFPAFPLRRRRIVGPIEITRGCPFACGYCQTTPLLGARPRHRSVESICRFAGVIRQRTLRDVRVVTPNAFSYGSPDGRTLNLPALESLLKSLRATLGDEGRLFFGGFPSEVRPEHVTPETAGLVRRFANNASLVIGAQSGSEAVLRRCGRGHTVADVVAAVSHTVAGGLEPQVDFIFGLPGETDEDLKDSMRLVRELSALGAKIHAHTFMPLPQTRFAHEPPGRISGRLRAVVRELIRQGVLFGVWDKQERHAARLWQQHGG